MKFKEYISAIDELPNNNLLTEAGLSRLIQKMVKERNDFAVISAYRVKYNKDENIKRNRNLRSKLNTLKLGVYQLVGHWQECEDENIPYKQCPKDKLIDVIERSYLVVRPGTIGKDEFKDIVQGLTKEFNQDCAVIALDNVIYGIESTGNMFEIGTNITLYKINQAYSQFVRNLDVPFVFEAEVPGSISGRIVFKHYGISYPVVDNNELREQETP